MSVFYILAVFFAITTRLLSLPEESVMISVLSGISTGCLISMVVSTIINGMLRSWVRFRDSFYKDEAYLTHTLPVTKSALYDSKLLQTLIFFLVGFVISVASLFIAYYTPETWAFVKAYVRSITVGLQMSMPFFVTVFIVIVFLELFNAIQCGFLGIILGHKRNSCKIGYSVLYGFLIYLAVQTVVLGMVFSYGLFDPTVMELFQTGTIQIDVNAFKTLAILACVLYMAIILAMSVICKKVFGKGVNIE